MPNSEDFLGLGTEVVPEVIFPQLGAPLMETDNKLEEKLSDLVKERLIMTLL